MYEGKYSALSIHIMLKIRLKDPILMRGPYGGWRCTSVFRRSVVIRIVACIITLIMVMRWSAVLTNARQARRRFSLNTISMTKPTFRLCMETLSPTHLRPVPTTLLLIVFLSTLAQETKMLM